MFSFDVKPPAGLKRAEIIYTIQRLAKDEGLDPTLKRSLNTSPGSVHWHYAKPPGPGTLEISFSPKECRIWLSVHANRKGPWTQQIALRLGERIRIELNKQARRFER